MKLKNLMPTRHAIHCATLHKSRRNAVLFVGDIPTFAFNEVPTQKFPLSQV